MKLLLLQSTESCVTLLCYSFIYIVLVVTMHDFIMFMPRSAEKLLFYVNCHQTFCRENVKLDIYKLKSSSSKSHSSMLQTQPCGAKACILLVPFSGPAQWKSVTLSGIREQLTAACFPQCNAVMEDFLTGGLI